MYQKDPVLKEQMGPQKEPTQMVPKEAKNAKYPNSR